MKPSELPPGGLIKPQSDEHDQHTFSQPSYPMPSTDLHDELNAHILRFAKDRFRRRMANAKKKAQSGPIFASIEGPPSEAPSSPRSDVSYQSERSQKRRDDMDIDEEENENVNQKEAGKTSDSTAQKKAKPQVSVDDEYSEELLKAPVRHILTQLDKTLMVLHHGRLAVVNHLDDPSDEDEEDFETGEASTARRKRARSRSRSQSRSRRRSATPAQPQAPTSTTIPPASEPPPRRGKGRPKKVHLPLEGETPSEMALRLARHYHRAAPAMLAKTQDAAFEAWLKQGEEDARREEQMRLEQESAAAAAEEMKGWREQKLDRLGLRDWSDVVGAAALAGFSDEVVDRTVKRCVKLFGEGMVMRRLDEVPLQDVQGNKLQERIYRPGEVEVEETDIEDEDITNLKAGSAAPASRLPSTSRRSSLAPSAAPTRSPTPSHRPRLPIPSTTPPPKPSPSRSRSHSRSRSRSAAADLYCPEPTCPRAIKGFDRKANLERHVKLVHGGKRLEDWEVDSDEEVVGGVRVDGFLREIVPETGWFKKKRSRQVVKRDVDDWEDEGQGFESD